MWIRFGRNEPRAPSRPLRSNQGDQLDLHRYRQDGTLLIFFAPPGGVTTCAGLFAALLGAAREEQEAALLVVTEHQPDLADRSGATVAYDSEGKLRGQYAALMATDGTGKPMLFVLDRDGSPAYAWVGACDEGRDIGPELLQKLQSAAFLCPECSVPDPAASVMWDVIY